MTEAPQKPETPEAAQGDEIVDTKRALEIMGVSRATLFNMIRDGRLSPLPQNGLLKRRAPLRFRRADLERAMPH